MGLDSYIAKQFKDPTGIGGKMISLVMNRQNRPLYEETIRLLSLSNTDSVLDIGCGNGTVLNMIARQCNCMLTGIDTSLDIINTASRRNHKLVRSQKAKFYCQNASEMSFADSSFNKAYTINTVYFWGDLGTTMAEIYRIMKPHSVFINTLYSNKTLSKFSHTQFGYKHFTIEQLTSAGSDVGFTVDVTKILDGAAYCVLYHKTNLNNRYQVESLYNEREV